MTSDSPQGTAVPPNQTLIERSLIEMRSDMGRCESASNKSQKP